MHVHDGQRVLVIGLAKSGEAAARLLLAHGARVVVNERRERQDDEPLVDALEALGARCVFGGHPLELLDEQPAFIVKNPGIPYSLPIIHEAEERGIPIYTEIEVASWFTTSPIYAITGSNGKTTTTTLVGRILDEAEQNPVVAGNIGVVLSGVVEETADNQPLVVEVSSFQLMGTESFHPKIGALLNLYPAHLDYHGDMTSYMEAKLRMFANMTGSDAAVLNYDQPAFHEAARNIRAELVWFSRKVPVENGVYIKDGQVVAVRHGASSVVMDVADIKIQGDHNVENALAATAIAIWAGAPVHAISRAISSFGGVEHRTEFVRTLDGVNYYNDSKATNPQATLGALNGFTGNVIWVAGGLDRGDSFDVLHDALRHRVRAAVLLGQTAERLCTVCKDLGVPVVRLVESIEEATQVARGLAQPGDTVLLSPAAASWDMFKSFEERGRIFKAAVHRL